MVFWTVNPEAATWLIIARNEASKASCEFPPSAGQAAAKPVSPPPETRPSKEGTVAVTLNGLRLLRSRA